MEKRIKDNRDFFEKEPSMDHMDNFLSKLNKEEKSENEKIIKWDSGSKWIGIAASVSLLISIVWFTYQSPIQNQKQQMGLSLELNEIRAYYTSESKNKLEKINNCTDQSMNTQKLIKTTKTQIMKLDYNVEKLESKLIEASGNKKIEVAYIQSLKAKSDLLNKMENEICSNQNIPNQ